MNISWLSKTESIPIRCKQIVFGYIYIHMHDIICIYGVYMIIYVYYTSSHRHCSSWFCYKFFIVRKSSTKFKLPSIALLLGSIPFWKGSFSKTNSIKMFPFWLFFTQAQLAVKAKNMAWIYDVSKGEPPGSCLLSCWVVLSDLEKPPPKVENSRARKTGLVKGWSISNI